MVFIFVVLIVPIDCSCVFFKISSRIYVLFHYINVYLVNSYCLIFYKGMSSSEDLSSVSTLDENAVIFPMPVKVKKELATDSEFEEKEAANLHSEQTWQETTSDPSFRRPRRRKAFLHGRRKSRKLLKSPSSEFVTKAKLKKSAPEYAFDIADWSVFDDFTLINSMIHLMNVRNVALGVQFNRNVSEKELLWRWESILFNKSVSENLTEKLTTLTYMPIREMQQKMPLNNYEMRLLYSVAYYSLPSVEVFENLINENADVFYKTRTAQELRECNLFAYPNPTEEDYSVLSEMIDLKMDVLYAKMLKCEGKIAALHKILRGKDATLDMIDGGLRPVGSLVGKRFSFMIRSPKITIGFSDENQKMDVDLTLQLGHRPTGLIKALCATLRIDTFTNVYLRSYVNDYVIVNGKKIKQMRRIRLTHGSLIQIYDVDLELELEEDLRREIKKQLIRKMLNDRSFSETFDSKPLLSDDD
ncbi:Microspherule protein 1 [Trichinella murrelli]|uniref:Microspherule protein 1 n=1 Tax=Trichinella murrelli TaxID=144512 RepID=A0A0V0TC91_9BILA|nr:Microspherule protein 1 [Trichinella murrelli]